MSTSQIRVETDADKREAKIQIIAGGTAGLVEATVCQPFDTIKTNSQLSHRQRPNLAMRARSPILYEPHFARPLCRIVDPNIASICKTSSTSIVDGKLYPLLGRLYDYCPKTKSLVSLEHQVFDPQVKFSHRAYITTIVSTSSPIEITRRIIAQEGIIGLYKGLTAVYAGSIPMLAIRFLSFEQYRNRLQSYFGLPTTGPSYSSTVTFTAGFASGLTEGILTPAEVCKIRMQSQNNSHFVACKLTKKKYTNVFQTAMTIVQEEGFGALYNGAAATMMRQGLSQAVNFTAYDYLKAMLLNDKEKKGNKKVLEYWESLILGGLTGGLCPFSNHPLDVVKTRMQEQRSIPGKDPKYKNIFQSCSLIAREEGHAALWKGITPRLLRIIPGKAVVFMTYEAVSSRLNSSLVL